MVIGPQFLLIHHFDVVLLVRVLLFVDVKRFLVQRLVEQLEILQTSLYIAVSPVLEKDSSVDPISLAKCTGDLLLNLWEVEG